jgi:hypothetical protein
MTITGRIKKKERSAKLFSLSQMDVKNKKKMFGAANNRPRKRIYFCYTECKEQEKFELSK